VHFRTDGPIETPVFLRETLGHGHEIRGPAIIEQMDATTILHPGDLAVVDEASNLIMKAAQ
jgi:N-methylhydantoinase A